MLSLVLVVLAAPLDPAAVSKALEAQGYVVKPPVPCTGPEETFFEVTEASCVSAKSKTPVAKEKPPTFPRVDVRVQRFSDEMKAYARLARFQEAPPELKGEKGKSYPLRAAFRVGNDVVVVTTDAFLFEREVQRVAKVLSKSLGGGEVSCWLKCAP